MRRLLERYISVLLAFLMLTGCAGSIKKYDDLYLSKDTTILLSHQPKNELNVLYTGCGGMLINSDSFSVLVDPFYSYKGLSIAWRKLPTNKRQADSVCRKINDKCGGMDKVGSVLIAHSHYDHLMDLPYLLNSQLSDKNVKIFGSASTANALSNIHLPAYRFNTIAFPGGKCYAEYDLNTQIKLFVSRSSHAPHVNLLGQKLKMMTGEIGPAGVEGFDETNYKAKFCNWKEGQDYSFLIEIKKANMQKPFRIFIQSSSCNPPAGIPTFLAQADSVDIAFIGVASTNYVENYPQELLRAIKPRHIVLIHWEDFFRPYYKKPKIVRATRFETFLSGYTEVMGADYKQFTSMPRQLTNYTFRY